MLVKRDPFAREELHRMEFRPAPDETCDWCGGTNRRGNLYTFRVETDGGRTYEVSGAFCCVGCYRAYHGQDM